MTSSYSRGPVVVWLPAHQHRWALAGFVLAMVLLALLVTVMNENITQAQSTREVAELKVQERGRCNAMRNRLEREQCLIDLRLGEQAKLAAP